ncbi:SCP-like extracellular [Beggiatoa leptomitoformis]|uniref:SCP-like extracellular n=2 Tax=Beggiatoa leptomitoformis TaxID=288004 RepID=A0A2N9YJM4_9GAMM|nr:SCP-like extracellular [Beggiatoa leptomitoformis]AUI70679.2 SCP-like extracellular [Beggiatoa leptomitoformis]
MVAAHNRWRQKVNVSAVRWSVDVASVAQRWANQLQTKGCPLEHSYQGGYGENIAASTGMGLTPERVVDLWASEVEDYDYVNNRCKAGKVCGHYTQVVWQASAEIGCGKASCGNTEVWVCNYNPPGNYVGTKPY